ncbi:glycosyltransferase family 4 protein [Spongisporangium articulatum]|uniref:Glycosyltransferase family 4 protein n=1 Tax=Spongisporangium articulatum TaxID=3362603 RepID=A0ABW8AT94_9ACTN
MPAQDSSSTGRQDPILFVHPSDELYGADRMLLQMLDALEAFGGRASAEVWLPDDLPHTDAPLCQVLEARGVRVRHLSLPIMRRAYANPRGLLRLAGQVARLAAAFRRARPQTVYVTSSASMLAAPAARLARVPKVVGHVQEIWSGFDRKVLTGPTTACHRLVAISTPSAESMGPRLARRAVVVPNGTSDPGVGSDLGSRTTPLTFLVASRWNGWKGHRTLLAAWDRLDAPGRLVVLGGPPPVGEAVDVPQLVAGLRHPDSVTVVGQVPDVVPHLEAADVAVVPSDEPEPFGLVAIEAFARGRPVIGSAAGGLADIITPGRDGWSFPPRDVDALAAVLAGLTRADVAEAGRQARTTYEERFTTTAYGQRWLAATGLIGAVA